MVEITNQQGAVLAFVSLATLGLVSAICLGCRKKSKIVQEDNQLYIPQIFQREGSRFAVTRSKTVTRPNQITSDQSPSFGNTGHASHIQPQAVQDTHSSYQNLPNSICGSLEPAYINPIPTPPSKDLPDELMDIDAGAYENVFPAKYIDHDSDSYDYENAQYLQNNDDDEPDYENTNPLVHHENMS
ncbi:LAT2 domain-containing protein isoform X2 [Astyanax mexicanus]|uniref:LAT2 domain-containing protein isoform X2 n=1 Tax=Astyanax mexicanus TaxID=7994 RepID=UPI000BBDBEE0|nr:LAT2 domain-containing protein isoform X2 [Astyanax mexicanus]